MFTAPFPLRENLFSRACCLLSSLLPLSKLTTTCTVRALILTVLLHCTVMKFTTGFLANCPRKPVLSRYFAVLWASFGVESISFTSVCQDVRSFHTYSLSFS